MSFQERHPTPIDTELIEREERMIENEAEELYQQAMEASSLDELRSIRDRLYELYLRKLFDLGMHSPQIYAYIMYVEAKIRDIEFTELREQLTVISRMLEEIMETMQSSNTIEQIEW